MEISGIQKQDFQRLSIPAFPQQNSKRSCCSRICAAYERAIIKLIAWLEKKNWHAAACFIGTLLLEPFSALRAGIDFLFHGIVRTPHYHNINPRTLTAHQLTVNPVLCIHGNYHAPSAFISIAKALKNSYNPAIFTVKLKSGDLTEEDRIRVNARIEEIKALYRRYGVENVQIDLVGHSRGADVADHASHDHWHYDANGEIVVDQGFEDWTCRQDIGKIILLGYHRKSRSLHPEKYFEINGSKDFVAFTLPEIEEIKQKVFENPEQFSLVSSGHLELLYSHLVQQKLIALLKKEKEAFISSASA